MKSLGCDVWRIAVAALILGVTFTSAAEGSDRLKPDLLKAVVRIETPPDAAGTYEIGSGFLIWTTPDNSGRILLITNKHLIGDWNYVDGDIATLHPWINVYFYRSGDPSGQSYRPTKVNLVNGAALLNASKVHLHPTPRIDLVAVDVTDQANDASEHIVGVGLDTGTLVPFEHIRDDWKTDIGDGVIVLGYPLGITSLRNNYPIAKVGNLASVPGDELSIPFPCIDRRGRSVKVTVEGKLLLIDGLIKGGDSGAPVFLLGGVRAFRDPISNGLRFSTEATPTAVFGIVSGNLGDSGLSIALSASYILELIHPPTQPPTAH